MTDITSDTMYQTLQYNRNGAVAVIRLDRPAKKNSLNNEMRQEMEKLFCELAGQKDTRAVIVTGGDDIFCAGADISEMGETGSAEAAYRHAREFQNLFASWPSRAIFALLPRPPALAFLKSRSAPFPAAAEPRDCRAWWGWRRRRK